MNESVYRLVNLTQHSITFAPRGGLDFVLPPSGTVARVVSDADRKPSRRMVAVDTTGCLGGSGAPVAVPVLVIPYPYKNDPGRRIVGLPVAAPQVLFVASRVVQELARVMLERTDVVSPNDLQRNGPVITCCRGLATFDSEDGPFSIRDGESGG